MLFIRGKKLSELYYTEVIKSLLSEHFPSLVYSAAQLDWGSDVIDMDTPMSMDHGWGPRLTLYITEQDFANYSVTLDEFFANNLPFEFRGFSTHFVKADSGSLVMEKSDKFPIHHMITVTTLERFFSRTLGVDIKSPFTPSIWLTIPQQRLLTLRSGKVFHDGLGTLESTRARFDWYPDDLWRYLLANQWQRIDQDAPFIGRTGYVADELGSRLLGARLVTDLMNLAFLMEKQYAPYRKWFGSAFQNLALSKKLCPCFKAVLGCTDWKTREAHLSEAYRYAIEAHNALGLTEEIPTQVHAFHDRPFLVPPAGKIVEALLDGIKDPDVKSLPSYVGSVNQISDSTDVLDDISICKKLRALYF